MRIWLTRVSQRMHCFREMIEFVCYKSCPACELEISATQLRKQGQKFVGCS